MCCWHQKTLFLAVVDCIRLLCVFGVMPGGHDGHGADIPSLWHKCCVLPLRCSSPLTEVVCVLHSRCWCTLRVTHMCQLHVEMCAEITQPLLCMCQFQCWEVRWDPDITWCFDISCQVVEMLWFCCHSTTGCNIFIDSAVVSNKFNGRDWWRRTLFKLTLSYLNHFKFNGRDGWRRLYIKLWIICMTLTHMFHIVSRQDCK